MNILSLISCVSSIMKATKLLLGVCRLYSDDDISTWETEWELQCIGMSVVTSFRAKKKRSLLLGLFLILPFFKRFSILILKDSLEALWKSGILIMDTSNIDALTLIFNICDNCCIDIIINEEYWLSFLINYYQKLLKMFWHLRFFTIASNKNIIKLLQRRNPIDLYENNN